MGDEDLLRVSGFVQQEKAVGRINAPLFWALYILRGALLKTRPKRIWAICLMLILIPSMSLFLSSYLLITNKMPAELEITIYNLVLMYLIPLGLISTSIMFFFGKRNSHRYVLSLSIAYFGMLIYQNAYMLYIHELQSEAVTKISTNIIRSSIELILVAWVVFSAKTKTFMASNV